MIDFHVGDKWVYNNSMTRTPEAFTITHVDRTQLLVFYKYDDTGTQRVMAWDKFEGKARKAVFMYVPSVYSAAKSPVKSHKCVYVNVSFFDHGPNVRMACRVCGELQPQQRRA